MRDSDIGVEEQIYLGIVVAFTDPTFASTITIFGISRLLNLPGFERRLRSIYLVSSMGWCIGDVLSRNYPSEDVRLRRGFCK